MVLFLKQNWDEGWAAPVQSLKGSLRGNNMICSSENIYPEPKVSWSPKPAEQTPSQIVKNDNGLYSISSSASMKLEPPQQFTCNISNENSWKSATYTLYSPVQRSSSVILRCSDSSAPVKSLKWTFNYHQTILTQREDDVTYTESWKTAVERVSEYGDLHLKDLSSKQEGVYLCELHTDQHSFFSRTEIKPKPPCMSRWRNYVSGLSWEHLGILPEELEEVCVDREVWASLMKLWKLLLLWTWSIASGQEPAPAQSLMGEFRGDVMVCGSENIYPEPTVSWNPVPAHQTQPQIVKNDNGLYSISSSASMKLEPPQQFTCNISNENSWKSATYSLNSPVNSSSSVTLQCSDSSAPVKSLKWTFNHNQTILTQNEAGVTYTDSWRTNVEQLSAYGDLHLKDLSSKQEGVYLCELHTDQHSFFSRTELKPEPPSTALTPGQIAGAVFGGLFAICGAITKFFCSEVCSDIRWNRICCRQRYSQEAQSDDI
ncbi:hypothetical protein WMY93_015349 [Mugilogobius chulae]|uniref:Ig-like domain-containing protein n=1 Tax=Mugilogobius chulae TaxID=88201 RepID=A0AAW0NR01_9GOBI